MDTGVIAGGALSACRILLLVGFYSGGAGSSLPCVLRWFALAALIGTPSAGRGLASVVSIPSGRRETGTECKGSFRRPLSYRLYPQDDGSTTAPVLLRALGVADGFGDRRGGNGDAAGGGTLVGGGEYLRYCVGGARAVCAETF